MLKIVTPVEARRRRVETPVAEVVLSASGQVQLLDTRSVAVSTDGGTTTCAIQAQDPGHINTTTGVQLRGGGESTCVVLPESLTCRRCQPRLVTS